MPAAQIKADAEGAAGRSYNYRVVMHCGEAELDMRGRCSAGQKVWKGGGGGGRHRSWTVVQTSLGGPPSKHGLKKKQCLAHA